MPAKRLIVFLMSVLIVSLAVPAAASAEVLLTNKPWAESGGVCLGVDSDDNTWQVGAKFTVGPHAIRFGSVEAKFHDPGPDSVFHADLHADSDGPDWGSVIASLGSGSDGDSEFPELEFYPGAEIILNPLESYWVVVSVPGEDEVCTGAWPVSPSANEGFLEYSGTWYKQTGEGPLPPVQIEISGDVLVPQIPSLNQWGLLLTILLLAAAGGLAVRRSS